jgi:hypothetical protein
VPVLEAVGAALVSADVRNCYQSIADSSLTLWNSGPRLSEKGCPNAPKRVTVLRTPTHKRVFQNRNCEI